MNDLYSPAAGTVVAEPGSDVRQLLVLSTAEGLQNRKADARDSESLMYIAPVGELSLAQAVCAEALMSL